MSKLGVPGYQTSDIDAPEIADKLTGAVPQAAIVMCHIGGVLGYCAYAGRKGEIHGGTGGSLTRCWRERIRTAGPAVRDGHVECVGFGGNILGGA